MPTHYGSFIIHGSKIRQTDIDMNMSNITSLADPINTFDAANKHYIDKHITELGGSSVFVVLSGIEWTDVCNLLPGSYIVVITTTSVNGGPTAMFTITRADEFKNGNINRQASSPGNNTGEQIELTWNAGEILKVRKSGFAYDGNYTISFNTKTISSLPTPPSLPEDAASKSYVDKTVHDALDIHFSGAIVELSGMKTSIVNPNLAIGSYTITVTPIGINNAPTAVFAVSKNSIYSEAMIVVSAATPGLYTMENLTLAWPSAMPMILSKNGLNYDGQYRVDFGNKNIRVSTEPIIPSDVATMGYVQNEIEMKMNAQFGGYDVTLNGIEFSDVASLRLGCYSLTISPLIVGGPTGSFIIAKNETEKDAVITRLISVPGKDSNEELEVTWLASNPVQLRKTSIFHDGTYRVDVNLKNIAVPTPILESDVATKEYVDKALDRIIQTHFDGITVSLNRMDWVDVFNLQSGSYLVTVNGLCDGTPTALFTISKSTQSSTAQISKISGEPGRLTGESLCLSWDANAPVRLSKTGPFHDGEYKIDFGLRNYATKPPEIPTDVATKNYVDDTMNKCMQQKFGGIIVTLTGLDFSIVGDFRNGSYIISISPQSQIGPSAIFAISKSSQSNGANIACLSSTPGPMNEVLNLSWDPNFPLMLKKNGTASDGKYILDFGLKNTIPEQAIHSISFEEQLATRDYVNSQLSAWKENFFSGIQVDLSGTAWSTVCYPRMGAFILTVSSIVPHGAAAVFAICKTTDEIDGSITCLNVQCAKVTKETFEMRWLAGKPLQIHKTLPFHDGKILCDFSIKNFSSKNNSLPSDIATYDYVKSEIERNINTRLNGVMIDLNGIEWTDVILLQAGSYIITVSPTFDTGPSAVFAISTDSINKNGTTITILQSPIGDASIIIEWPALSHVRIRKTSLFYDGQYHVDFNLKNAATIPEPQLPSDVVTNATLKRTIENVVLPTVRGTEVDLNGITWFDVLPLRPGSYVISVSNEYDVNFPTAIFMISKNQDAIEGLVSITSRMAGCEGCNLEMKWPPNDKLKIRKTLLTCDGRYTVNFNIKNQVMIEYPISSTDIVTKQYVDDKLKNGLDIKGNGILIILMGTLPVSVYPLVAGSYVITINGIDQIGMPTATVSLSKSCQTQSPDIAYITQSLGIGTGERLIVTWGPDEPIKISKNGNFYNGKYRINFNIQNSQTY